LSKINKTLEELEKVVADLGLTLFGVVGLGPEADYSHFEKWIEEGAHAGMEFMTNYSKIRQDSSKLLDGAKSAIVFGLNYYQDDKMSDLNGTPLIAQYARLRDYHKYLRKIGEQLLEILHKNSEGNHAGRVVVDTAPVLERSLASRSKRGFIGKNTLFIHPDKGSFFLLGEVITTLDLKVDEKQKVDPSKRTDLGGCGSCKRCQVNCPTGALDKDYFLDANKCISYWTIEHRGEIPREYWQHLDKYVFGCDICQLVCPYNRSVVEEQKLTAIKRISKTPELYKMATMDESEYIAMFAGTPATRAKREGLMRNALIAMFVTNDPKLKHAINFLEKNGMSEVVKKTLEKIKTEL